MKLYKFIDDNKIVLVEDIYKRSMIFYWFDDAKGCPIADNLNYTYDAKIHSKHKNYKMAICYYSISFDKFGNRQSYNPCFLNQRLKFLNFISFYKGPLIVTFMIISLSISILLQLIR